MIYRQVSNTEDEEFNFLKKGTEMLKRIKESCF
jgi:hypothetical protein